MSRYHYESAGLLPQQIHELTDSELGFGVEAPIATVQRLLRSHGGSTRVKSHVERRAAVLWRNWYGYLQGCTEFGQYLQGEHIRIPAYVTPPKTIDPGADDVVLVDTRVPILPLCAFLGTSCSMNLQSIMGTNQVYWARLRYDRVTVPAGQAYDDVFSDYRVRGMSVYDALAALVQRVELPELLWLPGTTCSPQVAHYLRDSRGVSSFWFEKPTLISQEQVVVIGCVERE